MLITTASCLSIVFTVDEDSLKVFSMEEQFLKSGHPVASLHRLLCIHVGYECVSEIRSAVAKQVGFI
jgi:hypothetical protein